MGKSKSQAKKQAKIEKEVQAVKEKKKKEDTTNDLPLEDEDDAKTPAQDGIQSLLIKLTIRPWNSNSFSKRHS